MFCSQFIQQHLHIKDSKDFKYILVFMREADCNDTKVDVRNGC